MLRERPLFSLRFFSSTLSFVLIICYFVSTEPAWKRTDSICEWKVLAVCEDICCKSVMSSSLVNSLAKVYDPNPLHGQKPGGRKLSLNGSDKSQPPSSSSSASSYQDVALRCVETRMDSLSSQMERLLNMQQTVLTRLDGLSQDVRGMGRDLASMHEEGHGGRRGSGAELCRELCGAMQRASERMESQGRRLEGVEKLVEGTQQVISFIGEVVKSSRLVELLFKQPGCKANKKVRGLKTIRVRTTNTVVGSITDVSVISGIWPIFATIWKQFFRDCNRKSCLG